MPASAWLTQQRLCMGFRLVRSRLLSPYERLDFLAHWPYPIVHADKPVCVCSSELFSLVCICTACRRMLMSRRGLGVNGYGVVSRHC